MNYMAAFLLGGHALARYGKLSDVTGRGIGSVVRNKRSALRHKNNGATAIPHSELHLALMSENGAMRLRSAVTLTLWCVHVDKSPRSIVWSML
jgi:hypothetical protein